MLIAKPTCVAFWPAQKHFGGPLCGGDARTDARTHARRHKTAHTSGRTDGWDGAATISVDHLSSARPSAAGAGRVYLAKVACCLHAPARRPCHRRRRRHRRRRHWRRRRWRWRPATEQTKSPSARIPSDARLPSSLASLKRASETQSAAVDHDAAGARIHHCGSARQLAAPVGPGMLFPCHWQRFGSAAGKF